MPAIIAVRLARSALALGLLLSLLPLSVSADEGDAVDVGVDVAGVQVGKFHCVDSAATAGCLSTDYTFDDEIGELAKTSTGRPLLDTAARSGVTIEVTPSTAAGLTATFAPSDNTVRLGQSVKSYPLPDRLAILAHELQHAADAAAGLSIQTPAGCYGTEQNAVATETRLWTELFDRALPAPRTAYEAWLNLATRSSAGVTDIVQSAYQAECEHVRSGA